jgi:hypothetical protein
LNVKKIVMLTDPSELDVILIACLQILFPMCEIQVNPPGYLWPEKEPSFVYESSTQYQAETKSRICPGIEEFCHLTRLDGQYLGGKNEEGVGH